MTSLLFVERRQGDAPPVLDAVEGSGVETLRAARREGLEPLLWGSWDLVEIAGHLVGSGARATEATLATSAMDLVRDDGQTADEIVDALNEGDLDAVERDLVDHAYLLAAITVRLPNVGLVRLIQNGQADVFATTDRSVVLDSLRSAISAAGR